MKITLIIFYLFVAADISCAEIYRWEADNVMNFSDNPASVPDNYRENTATENEPATTHTHSNLAVRMPQQNKPYNQGINQARYDQVNAKLINLEEYTFRQQQARLLEKKANTVMSAIHTAASYIVVWIIFILCLEIVGLLTIIDIIRNDFSIHLIKTVWIMLVLFVPLLGIVLYYAIGLKHKIIAGGERSERISFVF